MTVRMMRMRCTVTAKLMVRRDVRLQEARHQRFGWIKRRHRESVVRHGCAASKPSLFAKRRKFIYFLQTPEASEKNVLYKKMTNKYRASEKIVHKILFVYIQISFSKIPRKWIIKKNISNNNNRKKCNTDLSICANVNAHDSYPHI